MCVCVCVCVCVRVCVVQDQASEAMEVLDELMESEVSIIVPHINDIVHFCLEVSVVSCAMSLSRGLLERGGAPAVCVCVPGEC